MPNFFETPLLEIRHIGNKYAKRLERLGLRTVHDLLQHFPNRYEDFSRISSIADLAAGEQTTIQGTVETINLRKSFRRRMIVVEGFIRDATGLVRVVWFNQPYLKNTLTPGRLVNISGKVSEEGGEVYFSHPAYEIIDRKILQKTSIETRHTGRLIPIYPETNGLTSRTIRFLIQPILQGAPKIPEWIPQATLKTYDLPEINQALRQIHFPETPEEASRARERFAFESLFLLQLMNAQQRAELESQTAPKIKVTIPEIKKTLETLPFALTLSQKKSLWEIIQDLAKNTPMNRLLQGDVGSGKTVVAALAALFVAKNDYQTAILAPTEVLANQHFLTLKKLFSVISSAVQPTVGLLTGHRAVIFYESDLEKEVKKEKFKEYLQAGKIKIAIGTHAMIEKNTNFENLGLAIVDEQHRFGVAQRAALAGGNTLLPHFLSMSATPIPRTLTLAIFGDLDLSVINELPHGRKRIETKVVSPAERSQAYELIRREFKAGRQAFVVCPRIEPTEKTEDVWDLQKLEIKSVKEEYQRLSREVFPSLRVAMLHGQMASKEKRTVMHQFQSGEIDILVSTSVIEVGVDVPNATVMAIEGSDRFGLAQLYQFRGRVGRGSQQSYCLLFTESSGAAARERLKAIVEAKNGFELAEKDLVLRGPGQFLGKEQTGFPDTLMSGLQNVQLLKASRNAALALTKDDPQLKKHPLLKEQLIKFGQKLHQE